MSRMDELEKNLAEAGRWIVSAGKRLDEANATLAETNRALAESDKKHADWMVEHNARMEEGDRKHAEWIEESNRKNAEWAEEHKARMREIDKKLDRIGKYVGDMGNTNGRLAEEFFFAALSKTKRIGDVRFDGIQHNVSCMLDSYRRAEYDVVLTSDEAVAVVEVKHNVREDDVDLLHRWTEPHLREFLGLYRFMNNQPLLVAVAGMLVEDKAIARAHEYGYAVLTPDGQNIRVDSEFLRHIPHAA